MPDDKNKGTGTTPASNTQPTGQTPAAGGEGAQGQSGTGGGNLLGTAMGVLRDLVSPGGGGEDGNASSVQGDAKGGESGATASQGTASNGANLNIGDLEQQEENMLGANQDGTSSSANGLQSTLENSEASQPSMADQIKELNEVQVDKAFVADSLNLLGTLSFDKIIGNPLRAAIKAQRDLAKETLSYIREEGLNVDEKGQGQIVYVTMSFLRDGKQVKMRVPLLTLMPVPRLSITNMTYTFKAKVDALSAVVASVGSGGTPILNTTSGGGSKPSSSPQTAPAGGASAKPAPGAEGGKAKGGTSTQAAAAKSDNASGGMTPITASAMPIATATKASAAPAIAASYSSKKDSGATRDSRYSVETTMDITITASEGEMPRGIDRLLGVLDDSTEVIDPNGTLQVSADQTSLVNGYAAISVSYRNGRGAYQPKTVKCIPLSGKKAPSLLENGDEMLLVFNEKGAYKVSADKLQRIVFVS